jgi:bacterioferritin
MLLDSTSPKEFGANRAPKQIVIVAEISLLHQEVIAHDRKRRNSMSADTTAREQNSGGFGQSPLSSVEDMRARARHHIESGAVTEEYKADRLTVIKVLNEVLASELICWLRYKSHFYRATGIDSQAVKPEFLQHAQEASRHADLAANRIVQLNGSPDFNPDGLTSRSRSEYKPASTLLEMIKEDLIAERIAVEFYSEIIRWLGDSDLTTRKLMQDILAVEAQHAEDMQNLLGRMTRNRAGLAGGSR